MSFNLSSSKNTNERTNTPTENDEYQFDRLKTYKAKVYRYSRPVQNQKIPLKGDTFNHWGVVIYYLEEDEDEALPGKFLYEATNDDGILWARFRRFKKQDESIKGANLYLIAENHDVSKQSMEEYCHLFNQKREKYVLTKDNCQQFVNDMLMHLSLSQKWAIRRWTDAITDSSKSSFVSSGKLVSHIMEKISFKFSGKWICNTLTNLGIGKELAQEIVNELVESGLYKKYLGSYNWWQLFQILSEILVKNLGFHFFEAYQFDRETCQVSSFAMGKLAGLVTAIGVGYATLGIGPAVLFWFGAEIIGQLLYEGSKYVLGEKFTYFFGNESDWEQFFRICEAVYYPSIVKYFEDLKIKFQ